MKKILFISNVISHIYAFHVPYIRMLQKNGYEVHVMANGNGQEVKDFDKFYDVKIERSPFSIKNVLALKEAKKIINEGNYDLIHCHTPMGGVIGRLASRKARKKGTKVIYTAHGFHFYKGAPKKNWLLYFTMEKFLAKYTDCIITINKEDFQNAKKFFESSTTKVEKINGIGVDIQKFSPVKNKEELKKENDYNGKFLLTYAAEFIPRKNHQFFVQAATKISKKYPNIVFLFAGKGELQQKVKEYSKKLGVAKYIDFLGFRKDMPKILQMSDVLISASTEEGFGINIIEGMSSGLPAVVSNVRGHKEMIESGKNGYMFDVKNILDFCNKIEIVYKNKKTYDKMSKEAILTSQKFCIGNSLKQMKKIYKNYIKLEVEDSV